VGLLLLLLLLLLTNPCWDVVCQLMNVVLFGDSIFFSEPLSDTVGAWSSPSATSSNWKRARYMSPGRQHTGSNTCLLRRKLAATGAPSY